MGSNLHLDRILVVRIIFSIRKHFLNGCNVQNQYQYARNSRPDDFQLKIALHLLWNIGLSRFPAEFNPNISCNPEHNNHDRHHDRDRKFNQTQLSLSYRTLWSEHRQVLTAACGQQ
ncbi:hypothetical protein D3C81_1858000 [compost metagenome]